MTTWGIQIRRIRKSRSLSQAELAAKVGLSSRAVRAIERDERNLHVAELLAFASALDVDPALLYTEKDPVVTIS